MRPTRTNEAGMVTVSYMLATGLSLVVITWCTMFIVMSYTRASLRASAQRASRAGVVSYSISKDRESAQEVCDQSLEEYLDVALASEVRDGIEVECRASQDGISVTTYGSLRSISSVFPPLSINEKTNRKFESSP